MKLKKNEFKKDVELDSEILLAAMHGGMDGVMGFAFAHRDIFPVADLIVHRTTWFKELKDKAYVNQVELKNEPEVYNGWQTR